jgi:hypothetical protein
MAIPNAIVHLTRESVASIDAELRLVNGRRRTRRLTYEDCRSAIQSVLEGEPFAWVTGGVVAKAYSYEAETTLLLIAKVGDRLFVGVGVADGHWNLAKPSSCWEELKPWTPHLPGALSEKLKRWIDAPDVIEVFAEPVTTAVEEVH